MFKTKHMLFVPWKTHTWETCQFKWIVSEGSVNEGIFQPLPRLVSQDLAPHAKSQGIIFTSTRKDSKVPAEQRQEKCHGGALGKAQL